MHVYSLCDEIRQISSQLPYVPNLKMAKEMVSQVNSFHVPRFDTLRWVPLRYRRILPLSVMKRYQCIVVGATRGEITVAFAVLPGRSVIRVLRRLTGRDIFPVLVDPARIQVLIHRIELFEQHRHTLNWPYFIHWFVVRSIIEYILSQSET
jgi:Type II secretion system (T2SS), protein E, N-terminal domain